MKHAKSPEDLLRMAYALALQRWRRCPYLELEELQSVAVYGLARAYQRYDPRRGAGISTIAYLTILSELDKHLEKEHNRQKWLPQVSLDAPLEQESRSLRESLSDRLPDRELDVEIQVELRVFAEATRSTGPWAEELLHAAQGTLQRERGQLLGLSKQAISHRWREARAAARAQLGEWE